MDLVEIRQAILGWSATDPALAPAGGDQDIDPAAPDTFLLLVEVLGDPPVTVEVLGGPHAPDRVVIRHAGGAGDAGSGSDQVVRRMGWERGGLLEARIEGDRVVLAHPCYLDGLDRHAFMMAIHEVAKARRLVVDRLGLVAPASDLTSQTLEVTPEAAVPAPIEAGPVPTASPPVAATPAPVAPTAPAAPAPVAVWSPTHLAGRGVRAWGAPDPSRPPVADLAAGVELRVLEQLGDWARVDASNGWTGWVDARLLAVKT